MRKYTSFILLAFISFLLNIFILTSIKTIAVYRRELLFLELMILLAILIAIKLNYNTRASIPMAQMLFAILTINSLIFFVKCTSIIPSTLLLINMYGLLYFVKTTRCKRKKVILTHEKRKEIEKLLGGDLDEHSEIIIEKIRYVAGKRGSYFYPEDHVKVNKIKKKNTVIFETKADAKKAGYKEWKD